MAEPFGESLFVIAAVFAFADERRGQDVAGRRRHAGSGGRSRGWNLRGHGPGGEGARLRHGNRWKKGEEWRCQILSILFL